MQAISQANPQIQEEDSRFQLQNTKNTSFSFRSLGQLQFNFKAKQCDFVLWISSIKETLSMPEDYKQLFIKNLILQFFRVHLGTRVNTDFFNERPEPYYSSPEVYPIENKFVLYGVDYLSTNMIKYMFWPVQMKVRWINDSACMLLTSYEQADDLFYHLKDPADYDLLDQNEEYPYRGWYQLQPYYIFGNQRKLQLRYAASNDFEVHLKENANRYGLYEKIVKIMPWIFLEKCEATQIYSRKLTRKRIRKEKQRLMQQQARRQQTISYWPQNQHHEEGFSHDQFYNIQEEYRFDDLNSYLADLEISIVGRNEEDGFEDGASFYSIVNESYLFNDQNLQAFSFNEILASMEAAQ